MKIYNLKRSAVSEISNLEEKFESFLSNYFGYSAYDKKVSKKWKDIIFEIRLYFKDRNYGGWSCYYCSKTWNNSNLENDADLEIFDLLFKIDVRNRADTSDIIWNLCFIGAFEAVKVRNS